MSTSVPFHIAWSEWAPKSFEALKNYNRKRLASDLLAGLTVGFVALPLAMAFAIASGSTPQAGLYTAVVAGFIISAFGGSRCQIGGPTGAFVVIIFGILGKYGLNGLLLCTIMAGFILLVMGLTGLGSTIKYIPRPVVMGFTNGIAILIASTQIKDFFGLKTGAVPGDFVGRMRTLFAAANTVNWTATALAAASLAAILLLAKFAPRVPGYIVALLGATLSAYLLHLPVETIGLRFGAIPVGLPKPIMPSFDFMTMRQLVSPAITVAMLGAIESLMSAVVADRMSGDQHNPNVELAAQGLANIFSPFFGGLPATGAIARTATNIRSGSTSPFSGIFHAITLVAILIFAAPLAGFVPMCALAPILFVVSWKMGQWHELPAIFRLPKMEVGVWAVTLLLTVFADLTVAVEAGMVMAALFYIREVTETSSVSLVTPDYLRNSRPHVLSGKHIPDYVAIYRIHGPFLFGSTEKIDEVRRHLDGLPAIVILRLRNMTALDSTGLQAIEELAAEVRASGRELLLCGARSQPAEVIAASGLSERLGEGHLCPNVDAALLRAAELHAGFDDGDALSSAAL